VRLPVAGPKEALSALWRGAESVEQLLAAVPRVVSLIGDAERMLARLDGLIDRIEQTRAAADEVTGRAHTVIDKADELLASSATMVDRLIPLLDGLQPTLDRLAETTDPREVDALITLVDHLPGLALKMETDIVPVLESLSTVAPDLHDLLDVSRELNEMLTRLPALDRIKRRVDKKQAAKHAAAQKRL
jgi:ABC-type transporter Mla subunit MlaD